MGKGGGRRGVRIIMGGLAVFYNNGLDVLFFLGEDAGWERGED